MSETNTTNIDTLNSETNNVYLTDSEDKYLLDKLGVYLTTTNNKENDNMATKKYVSLEKLGLYDGKIKGVISAGDATTLQSAKDYADGLATNYDAAGSAASALTEAKNYADGKDAAIAEAKKAGTDAAAAAGVADGKAVAAQNAADSAQADVDALETYVGTIPETATATNIVAYVQEKTSGIATSENLQELTNRVAQAETDIDNIEKDYLKAADKTELQGNIDTLSQTHTTDKAALEASIKAITDDYLKEADKTALQDQITANANAITVLTDGIDAEKVDGVKDLIAYVEEHGTEVTGIKEDIADNTAAIEGVAGRMTTAEGKITAVEGAVATKAEKTYVDEAVEALQGEDTAIKGRLNALEGAIGESGSVAEDIEEAKNAAIEVAASDATTKANTAESNAKAHADGLNTAMNTRVEALEAVDHDHANKAELDLIATGDKAKWDAAAAKAHEHSNLAVLEGITSAKVTAWDAAEGNAKTFAQGLNDTMAARMDAVESWQTNMIECSEEDINSLFTA